MYARVHLRRNFSAAKATWKLMTATATDGRATWCMFDCVRKTIAKTTTQNPMLNWHEQTPWTSNLLTSSSVSASMVVFDCLVLRWLHDRCIIFRRNHNIPLAFYGPNVSFSFDWITNKNAIAAINIVSYIHEWIHLSKIERNFRILVLNR